MDATRGGDLPPKLEGARRRFERWRETRKGHARIPGSLWASATRMAKEYGVSRTAHTLRLNSNALKKRLRLKAVVSSDGGLAGDIAQFVELAAVSPRGFSECLLEWEDAEGAKMRIRLQGVGMPDLAALSRSFWNRQP